MLRRTIATDANRMMKQTTTLLLAPDSMRGSVASTAGFASGFR